MKHRTSKENAPDGLNNNRSFTELEKRILKAFEKLTAVEQQQIIESMKIQLNK